MCLKFLLFPGLVVVVASWIPVSIAFTIINPSNIIHRNARMIQQQPVSLQSTFPQQSLLSSSSYSTRHHSSSSSLFAAAAAIDPNVLQGAAIALSGLLAGLALVAFTEERGQRGNLSENMATRIAGSLMEDVEVSSVADLGGLTSQLEKALRESGTIEQEGLTQVLQMTEEEKKKKAAEADDGW
jgi:hypothetical protein